MVETVKGWFTKFSNDWSMNLAAMLAYNMLTAIFPILLALLTIFGFALSWNHDLYSSVQDGLVQAVPANARGFIDVKAALIGLQKNSGILSIVSLLGLLWGGSNLFGVIENCFDIVFRTMPRDFIHQKIMAIGMIFVFAVLAPLMFGASTLINVIGGGAQAVVPVHNIATQLFFQGLSLLAAVAVAFALFLAIYVVVPNMPLSFKHAWRGALVAGALLVVINLIFPLYTSLFMSGNKNYGATAALALVVMAWFWFFSVVLMLGAEINSYAMGMRAMEGDIPTVIHHARVHDAGQDVDPTHVSKTKVGWGREKRANKLDTKGRRGQVRSAQTGDKTAVAQRAMPGRVLAVLGNTVGHTLSTVFGTIGTAILAAFWLMYRAVRHRGERTA